VTAIARNVAVSSRERVVASGVIEPGGFETLLRVASLATCAQELPAVDILVAIATSREAEAGKDEVSRFRAFGLDSPRQVAGCARRLPVAAHQRIGGPIVVEPVGGFPGAHGVTRKTSVAGVLLAMGVLVTTQTGRIEPQKGPIEILAPG